MENLWNLNTDIIIENPIDILRQQKEFLESMTDKLVSAAILEVTDKEDTFSYKFILVSPYLPNYSYKVFVITCSPILYPLRILCDSNINEELCLNGFDVMLGIECKNTEEYKQKLSLVLSTDFISQVVGAVRVMAQSRVPK